MKDLALIIEKERFLINDSCKYVLSGSIKEKCIVTAVLDGAELPVLVEEVQAESVMERFHDSEVLGRQRVEITVMLPEGWEKCQKLEIWGELADEKKKWFQIKVQELKKKSGRPQYYIEIEKVNRKTGILQISGWAAGETPVQIKLFDEQKQPVSCSIQKMNRVDVVNLFKEHPVEEQCGFFIEASGIRGKYMYLVMRDEYGRKAMHKIHVGSIQILQGKVQKYQKKGLDYLKIHGVQALAQKVANKYISVRERPGEYDTWLPKHLPSKKELEKQRTTVFEYAPKISLVVPLYKTNPEYLKALIESVQEQTYGNWELCLSDGSGENSPLAELLAEYQNADARIKVIDNKMPLQISENTNAALSIATGDYIAFGDHDDILTSNAFYEIAETLNHHPETEIIYTDEDKMTMEGKRFFQPHMKPDFNPDLLRTVNYICHLFVVKKELLAKVGTLRPEFDGAQDYDFILRCVEASNHIYHIPKILYHWRCHADSTAENPESKMYAFDAGRRAIEEHYARTGIKAEVYQGEYLGLYRTRYLWEEKPLVSILIPNKDHIDDLKRCINSIEEKTTYKNYEYIIIENNSTESETFAYYKELEASNHKVKVVYWDGVFNYSEINNFGASYANGEYLLLLNNDTEVINEEWMEEMLGYCMRRDVGIVGARLYYPDDTIQHAGVVIGFGGIAGHCFVQHPKGHTGYFHRIISAQNYSAVTAACMMVKRSVFDEVGGLTTELAVAFNDIDFCLKVRKAGYLIVYNPYAELYHYESKSRGLEDTPEKVARFNREIAKMEELWPDVFGSPDPYYNPNLTLRSQDFSLRKL